MKCSSLFAVLALAAMVSGCQSTSIRSAWFDTDFAGPPMRKIVVVGDVGATADVRLFEDTFAAKPRGAGVDAVAAHTIRLDPNTPEAPFVTGVENSGAQGLLFVRLLGVDTRTQVTTTMVPGGMAWGRGPWGGPWGAPVTRPMIPVQQVSQYDLATVETKLYDVRARALIWAATTSTLNPRSVAAETPAFADLVIGELGTRGIIARK